MDLLDGAAIAAAGAAAGLINAVVGSGTLVTFPTLLALGYPPVTANISNNIGLVLGNVTGTWGYRRELAGRGAFLLRLVPLSAAGAIAGALLLLALPQSAFEAVVPVLIALSVVLVLAQPRIAARAAARRAGAGVDPADTSVSRRGWVVVALGVLGAGVYGGYFGAAQGVLLIGVIGAVLLHERLQFVNGTKNLLSTVVNGVAAITFVIAAPEHVDWAVAGLIAGGSAVGGLLGAAVGRRLPPPVLRGAVALVGVTAVVLLVAT